MTLLTERLFIRDWTLEDVEANLRIYGDPEVWRYLGGGGKPRETLDECRAGIERLIEVQKTREGTGLGAWAICRKEENVPIGTVLLKPLPPGETEIEVGWHLGREFWGQGFATEAAREVMRHGFEEVGLREIFAVLFAENKRSWKVAERLGMEHLGSTDRYYDLNLELFRAVSPRAVDA